MTTNPNIEGMVWSEKAEHYVPLNESTTAAASLEQATKSKPNTTAEVDTLASFMKLPREHQKRTIDFLAQSLDFDKGDGDGVPNGTAAKNRKGLKDYPESNKKSLADAKKDLKEVWPEMTEEVQAKIEAAFEAAVSKASARAAIIDLLTDNPELQLAFADDGTIDVVEQMAHRINELEEAILEVEYDSYQIREAREAEMMAEKTLFAPPSAASAHRPRRSSRNLSQDFEPDESNSWLLETDQHQHQHISDPRMAARAAFLQQIKTTDN